MKRRSTARAAASVISSATLCASRTSSALALSIVLATALSPLGDKRVVPRSQQGKRFPAGCAPPEPTHAAKGWKIDRRLAMMPAEFGRTLASAPLKRLSLLLRRGVVYWLPLLVLLVATAAR